MSEALAVAHLKFNSTITANIKSQTIEAVARSTYGVQVPTDEQKKDVKPSVISFFNNNKKRVWDFIDASNDNEAETMKKVKAQKWRDSKAVV